MLLHELNHIWVNGRHGIQFRGNNSINGHWKYLERPSSAFIRGCSNGVFDSVFVDDNQIRYETGSYNTDFNDLELFMMNAISIDEIDHPIKIVTGVEQNSHCNREGSGGYFTTGRIDTLTRNDLAEYLDSRPVAEVYASSTIQMRNVIALSDTMTPIEMVMYDEYIKDFQNYFTERASGHAVISTAFDTPGQILDMDNDGFGIDDDCDDNNSNINPNQDEIPYNGIDDDCNIATLDDDLDQDGFKISDDCNDDDALINPSSDEIPDNEIDENCDGEVLITSSIHELNGTTISIYPNPTSDIVNIELDKELDFDILIQDFSGKTLIRHTNQELIDISELTEGVYIVTIIEKKSKKRVVDKITVTK